MESKIEWWWILVVFGGLIVVYVVLKMIVSCIQNFRNSRKLNKWANITRNSSKLIVHCPPIGKRIPSPSPFVLKLITFLRMHKIPFDMDHVDMFGGKGKTPWISLEGENVADSELIIEHLIKKYNIDTKGNYTPQQLATAEAVKIMSDEHMFWGMVLERFVYGDRGNVRQVVAFPAIVLMVLKGRIKDRADNQGIGLHSQAEMVKIISNDLKVISKILGSNEFILGSEPCMYDAGIFGQVSQFVWGTPNNPYMPLLQGECQNLVKYCERMRDTFWKDWIQQR